MTDAYIICQKCGVRLAADALFCGECGTKVQAQPPSKPPQPQVVAGNKCQGCGYQIAKDAQFCPECGKPVSIQGKAPAPVAGKIPVAPVPIPVPKKIDTKVAIAQKETVEVSKDKMTPSGGIKEEKPIEVKKAPVGLMCTNCGSAIKEGMMFCGSCGARVKKQKPCPQCGTPIDEEKSMCDRCAIVNQKRPVCPQCGAEIIDSMRFCGTCGATVVRVTKTEESVPAVKTSVPEPQAKPEPVQQVQPAKEIPVSPKPVAPVPPVVEPLIEAGEEEEPIAKTILTSEVEPITKKWKLVIKNASEKREIELTELTYTLGRSNKCQIAIKDERISTQHMRLFSHDGVWFIHDLGSTNGTFVNGQVMVTITEWKPGDKVKIGRTDLELICQEIISHFTGKK